MRPTRLLAPVLLASLLSGSAQAQVPSAAGPDRSTAGARPAPRAGDAPSYNDLFAPGGRSSLRRTMPYGNDASAWGYRNPGNVGKMAEYYPPNNQFQNENAGPHVAQFDQGPAATQRSAQLQSEALGVQRYNAIQSHIDRYGAPRFGFGFGFGGGGFVY